MDYVKAALMTWLWYFPRLNETKEDPNKKNNRDVEGGGRDNGGSNRFDPNGYNDRDDDDYYSDDYEDS